MEQLGIWYYVNYTKCNLHCFYCIVQNNRKSNKFNFERFKHHIEKIKQLPRKIYLKLGIHGEVFTSKEISEALATILNENNNIRFLGIDSNLNAS